MKVAFFDCSSGAGGDMVVGALIDAGADVASLRDGLTSLGLTGYELSIDSVTKMGIAATRFRVDLAEPKAQPHRHLRSHLRGCCTTHDKPTCLACFRSLNRLASSLTGTLPVPFILTIATRCRSRR